MKNYLLILVILSGLASCRFRSAPELRFHENGRFKIVLFTDLHWAPGLPSSEQTTATIRHLLQTEKPDLAVLTGDVVTATPAEAGWTAIIHLFDKARIPFTVVMGNRDAGPQVTRRQIYQWLALGFGRTTGAEAYCPVARGGRVTEWVEGKFQFETPSPHPPRP